MSSVFDRKAYKTMYAVRKTRSVLDRNLILLIVLLQISKPSHAAFIVPTAHQPSLGLGLLAVATPLPAYESNTGARHPGLHALLWIPLFGAPKRQ